MAYPTDLNYTKEHLWIKCDGDIATIGITEYAQDQLGEILYVDLPEVDDEISKGDIFSEVESSKTASELAAPFDGVIVEVNTELDDSPELINENAHSAWIVKIKVSNPDTSDFITAAEYESQYAI